jgi:hypothetical protein
MIDLDLIEQYNYNSYVPEKFERWLNWDNSPPVGTVAPDYTLWRLEDSKKTSLSAIWASYLYTVVEFGSITLPYCGLAAPAMNAIADQFEPHGIGSIFIYTHEAHPGEYFPHLTSMEQKIRHAKALRNRLGVTRPILLDTLDGACHRAYGSMPNMTWIFNRAGIPIYKADWTDSSSIYNTLDYAIDVANRRRSKERLSPFRVERLDYHAADKHAFMEGLQRNGPKAVEEYQDVYGEMTGKL